MGLFKKKEAQTEKESPPQLSELPKLPELPGLEDISKEPLHQLPSFPSNSLGEKFSQNSIKDAVTGEKEGEEAETNDFEEDFQMMSKPLDEEESFEETIPKKKMMSPREFSSKTEPIFIKFDKFEESLEVFKKTKDKIMDIEKMLGDIKILKEREQRELTSLENDLESIKKQIEKVDRDIFSKI